MRWRLRRIAEGRFAFGLLFTVVVAAGLGARALRCNDGLPYLHRWGEPNIAARSLEMLKTGDLNPHWFHYGSPTLYLHAAVDALHYLSLCKLPDTDPASLSSPDDILTQVDTGWQWDLSHPSFVLWNRLTTALIGTLALVLTYGLGRELRGRFTGLLAMALTAGAMVHVEVSTTIRADMPAACLGVGAILCSVLFLSRNRPGFLVWALVLAGLAASTKYNVALFLLAPLLALAIACWDGRAGYRASLWPCVLLIPPAAFLLGTPYALLDLSTFIKDAGEEVNHYVVRGHGQSPWTIEPGLPHVIAQWRVLGEDLGWISLIVAVPGLAVLLGRREGWVAMVAPAAYALFMANTRIAFPHNLAILVPFAALAAAVGAAWIVGIAHRWRPAVGLGLAFVVAALVALPLGRRLWQAIEVCRTPETRSVAMQRADALARDRGWRRIGVAKELRTHAVDLARLSVEYEVLPLEDLLQRRRRFDALVTPTEVVARQFDPPKRQREANQINSTLPAGEVVDRVDGNATHLRIRSIDPAVLISTP